MGLKIGIYGGTFNPPHLGHLRAAQGAVELLGLDKLYLIPARVPPHKELPENTPRAEDRLELTRIAADQLGLGDKVEVLDLELRREGVSYTSDTLRTLKERWPDSELWLLMGTDMFLTIQAWHEPEEVTRLAGLAAFGRTQQDGEALFAPQRRFLQEKYNAKICTITLPDLVEISSTRLRELLKQGKGTEYLAPAVYGYILRKGLYGTHADLKQLSYEQLRAASYSMVKAKRIPHIRGTEQEAVRLAEFWGCDVDEARTAAILHDCTKYLTLEEQLKLCASYGILLDDLEQRALKLLHSKTGAAIARDIYGVSDRIYEAIYWHTTGKAGMNLLEKIIYLADYMEPTRDFEGVERLRTLAYQDLDRAVLLGLEMTVEEMEEMGNPVHERTIQARDWLRQTIN